MPKANIEFSCELFPPDTAIGWNKLNSTVDVLQPLGPRFFSVTFGAGGSTKQSLTANLVAQLLQRNIATVPHVSCINTSRDSLDPLLEYYQSLGINRLVVVRGDRPQQPETSLNEFSYASELVNYIRNKTGAHFKIIVAAYPEFHPESENPLMEFVCFRKKIEAGANAAITQYFFNPDAYYRYRNNCEQMGIRVPIIPGIMPILQYEKLKRFSARCQAEIPQWLDKRLQTYQNDPESLQKFGIDVITKLCEDLIQYGAPSLHFYTLNSANPCADIIKNLLPRDDSVSIALKSQKQQREQELPLTPSDNRERYTDQKEILNA